MRTLHIVTCVSNPLQWKSRIALADRAIKSWSEEKNVHITVVECVYGDRQHQLGYMASDRIVHIPVRAYSLLWIKENLLNLGIQRLPETAQYIMTPDADIIYRKAGWANDVIHALDLYPVVQPWQTCYDLGPNDEHIWAHKSFAALHHEGKPVVPRFDDKTLSLTNDPYHYPHPGYVWAYVKNFLNWVGGLFEWGGVGAGDHHMALSLVNAAHMSIPKGVNGNYKNLLVSWQTLANQYNHGKLGFTPHTIEHSFHGRKENRAYNNRWHMFLKHNFDPVTDVKRNIYGVLEFAGNKPQLEKEWDRYLKNRNEDANSLIT